MFRNYLLLLVFLSFHLANAQQGFRADIKDADSHEPLMGVHVLLEGTDKGAVSNEQGRVALEDIPEGEQVLLFSFVGYEEQRLQLSFPMKDGEIVEVFLQPSSEEMEEVIISATRSRRSIADLPTRVEAISGEELEEKGNMKPGNIRMMLNETTGIQTQQTSATSYNSSIRI